MSENAIDYAVGQRAAKPAFLLILVLGSLSGLGPLAIDMYLPSFPAMAEDLGTTTSTVERTLAAYFAGLALGQLFYGPAADRFGRKPPMYVGLGLFILASIGCACAATVETLIALRFFQALGGCAEMVIARAVVRDRFSPRDAAGVFSSLMLVMGLAPVLAPLLGGWLLVHGGWRAAFWTLAGVGAACLASVVFFLPESLPKSRRQRSTFAATFRVGRALLTHRSFMAHTISGALISAGMFAYIAGSPFVFMELFHIAPQNYGFFFGANALGLVTASQVNRLLTRRFDARRVLQTSLAIAACAGMMLLVSAFTGMGGFPGILIPLFVFIGSMGFVMPTTTALAMAPHGSVAGQASAVLGATQFLINGAAGLLVSALHDDTAVPMSLVIAACGVGSLLIDRLAVRPASG